MDIGTNLSDTIRYQSVHDELINKLKVNSNMIIESVVLLSPIHIYLG